MQSYSITRMRAQCRTLFRPLIVLAAVNLLFASLFGALWKVMDAGEDRVSLIFAGVMLALFLLEIGIYLVVSDIKWMLRHTLYGKILAHLGNAEDLAAEIDKEARRMVYEGRQFALLENWLMLYHRSFRSAWGTGSVETLPIRKKQVRRITWEKESKEENAAYLVRVFTANDSQFTVSAEEQADIQALRQWGAALQEKQEL